MAEKPKMYQNREYKEFHNNKEVFMSMDRENTDRVWDSNDIRKKINDIIDAPNFIYRANVNILIGNELIKRKIVGIYNNNLITIDNEHIPIDSIKDIYR